MTRYTPPTPKLERVKVTKMKEEIATLDIELMKALKEWDKSLNREKELFAMIAAYRTRLAACEKAFYDSLVGNFDDEAGEEMEELIAQALSELKEENK